VKTLIDQRLVYNDSLGTHDVILLHATFFECLGLSSIFEKFPELNEQHKLFSLLPSILEHENKNDLLVHFYDQVFVECLTHVKAMPEINSAFLLELIEKRRGACPFSKGLDLYEILLLKHPEHLIHDLILHLAWDRTCVYLASLFDRDISGLSVLKDCLVESFQHITSDGKSVPSVFRFIEALYSYYLKKDNLSQHTEEEWQTLSQGSIALQPRSKFIAVPYIDVVAGNRKVLTLDPLTQVKAAVSLTQCIFEKLKKENPGWSYNLSPVEVSCLQANEKGFEVESVFSHL
jgi:hypothetical protein